jgi:hypothetical protein
MIDLRHLVRVNTHAGAEASIRTSWSSRKRRGAAAVGNARTPSTAYPIIVWHMWPAGPGL